MSPDGPNVIAGPGANIASGFGGLGLDGIKGIEDSLGESPGPPGDVGKRGLISGDIVGDGDDNGEIESGKIAGAAEIVEAGKFISFKASDDDDEKNAIKIVTRYGLIV
ncbi:hypothetical protein CASFOL_010004 [Castilleja foliolosa]|uniref:Uncharacterized protein n=1 Tax=Castilleja foliolosa TaxID=1961234 RepID=A0ABD3DV08_9LAMI